MTVLAGKKRPDVFRHQGEDVQANSVWRPLAKKVKVGLDHGNKSAGNELDVQANLTKMNIENPLSICRDWSCPNRIPANVLHAVNSSYI